MKNRLALVLAILFLAAPAVMAEGNLVDDLKEIMDKQWTLEQKIEKILASPGVKVNGQLKFMSTDVLYMSGGSGAFTGSITSEPVRYRPMVQMLDLDFNTRVTKELSLSGIFRFEYLLGGAWGYYNEYGVRRLYAKGNTDFADFTIGDYQSKMTSLTLMPAEDRDLNDFQSDIYAMRKNDNKSDIWLLEDKWPLSGATMSKKFNVIDKTLSIGYQLNGAFLGRAGDFYYLNAYTYINKPITSSYYILNHNQFMYSAAADITIMDMVTLGGSYLDMFEAPDSGLLTAVSVDSSVFSGVAKLNVANMFYVNGEFAMSAYDPGYDPAGINNASYEPVTGTALKAELELKLEYLLEVLPKISIKGGYLMVDNDYIAPGAQTRTYEEGMNPWQVLTQNNTWNVMAKFDETNFRFLPQRYYFINQVYPLTMYTNTIKMNEQYRPNYDSLFILYNARDMVFPFGDATPNRAGAFANLTINIAGGSKVVGFFAMPSTIKTMSDTDPVWNLMQAGGGAVISILDNMIELKGGAKMENALYEPSVASAKEDITIMTVESGLKVRLFGALDVLGGLEMVTQSMYNGVTDEYDTGSMTSFGGGLKYNIQKGAYMAANYTTSSVVPDEADDTGAANIDVEEIDINLVLSF